MVSPRFRSEGSFLLVALGVTLGTGSLWRFPRLLAQEGSAFLLPWAVGLALWAYPLLLTELAIGKRSGLGLPGAFARLRSGRDAWVGTLLTITAFGMLSTVACACGWCLAYFVRAWTRDLFADPRTGDTLYHLETWVEFSQSWGAVPYVVISLAIASAIVGRGVRRGLEWGHVLLVPSILITLFLLAMRGLASQAAIASLVDALHFQPERLLDPDLWLTGLQQAGWSTAAGFGWLATYASSAPGATRPRWIAARMVLLSAGASLLMALAVLPLAYGPSSPSGAAADLVRNEYSFAFVWLPTLLSNSLGGSVLGSLYYTALATASLLTLVALLETVTRVGVDLGTNRLATATAVAGTAAVLALPGILRRDVLDFQRWTLELLLVSGAGLLALQVARYGVARLHREVIDPSAERAPLLLSGAIQIWIPIGAAALVIRSLVVAWSGGLSMFRLAAAVGVVTLVCIAARAISPDLVRGIFASDLERRPTGESRQSDSPP